MKSNKLSQLLVLQTKMKHKFNLLGFYSLIIGTILFLSFIILRIEYIAVVGYLFLIAAVVTNIIIAFILFVQAITIRNDTSKNLGTIGLMLCNIPIAYLYVLIVFNEFSL